jgi:uncharacterized membrane protein YgdD (TMEM256/DUF423 family)
MNLTTRRFIRYGTFMMALSIALGAFGAHAIKSILDEHMFAVYNTAVEYQFYHSLGMFVVAFIATFKSTKQVIIAGNIMIGSTFLFCGSLYALTITGIKTIGMITPIGGVGFIVAWIMLGLSVTSLNYSNKIVK